MSLTDEIENSFSLHIPSQDEPFINTEFQSLGLAHPLLQIQEFFTFASFLQDDWQSLLLGLEVLPTLLEFPMVTIMIHDGLCSISSSIASSCLLCEESEANDRPSFKFQVLEASNGS